VKRSSIGQVNSSTSSAPASSWLGFSSLNNLFCVCKSPSTAPVFSLLTFSWVVGDDVDAEDADDDADDDEDDDADDDDDDSEITKKVDQKRA
jgi:hypothetical protein